jgi:putative copper export protein
MTEPDRLAIILRALIYVGSIAAAGGVLFSLSFPSAARLVESSLKRQVLIGCWLILLAEPVRYVAFQLAAAEGNWSAAFAPDLRWTAFETGFGRAAAVRVIAAAVMIAANLRWRAVSAAAAIAMIASFALEGHTVSGGSRWVLAALLLMHFAAIAWWIGALYPLLVVLRRTPPDVAAATIRTFSRRAMWIVLALLTAGALLLLSLTGAELDPSSEYQQRFARKLMLVAILLALATWNKLRVTPLLATAYEAGARKLRRSIRGEIAVAAMILSGTAWIISVSPHP